MVNTIAEPLDSDRLGQAEDSTVLLGWEGDAIFRSNVHSGEDGSCGAGQTAISLLKGWRFSQ